MKKVILTHNHDELTSLPYQPTVFFMQPSKYYTQLRGNSNRMILDALATFSTEDDIHYKSLLETIYMHWRRDTPKFTLEGYPELDILSDAYEFAVDLLQKIRLDCSWYSTIRWSRRDFIGAALIHSKVEGQSNMELNSNMKKWLIKYNQSLRIYTDKDALFHFIHYYRNELNREIQLLFAPAKIEPDVEGQELKVQYIKEGLMMMEYHASREFAHVQGIVSEEEENVWALDLQTGKVFHK